MVYSGNFRRKREETKFINQVKIEPDMPQPKRAISSAPKTQKIKLDVHKPGPQKMKQVEMKVTKKSPGDNLNR